MTTLPRIACLMGILLLGAGSSYAQAPIFGFSPKPEATDTSREFAFDTDRKIWEIPVSEEGADRLIKVDILDSARRLSANLCPEKTLLRNGEWAIAAGTCTLTVTPMGVGPIEETQITVFGAARDGVETVPLTAAQETKAAKSVIQVRVTLLAPPSTVPAAGSVGEPGDLTLIQRLLSSQTLLIVAILVVIGTSGVFAYRRMKRPGDTVTAAVAASGTASGTSVMPGDSAAKKTATEHAKSIVTLQSATAELEKRLEDTATRVLRECAECNEQALSARNEERQRLHLLEGQVLAMNQLLGEHLAHQSSALREVFANLPTLAEFTAPATTLGPSDFPQLEARLIDAIKAAALTSETLATLRREIGGVEDALDEFTKIARALNRERADVRLGRPRDGAHVLQSEIANFNLMAAGRKHGFYVEMSLLDDSSLGKDLAAALAREVAKLKDPESYYEKRLMVLRAQAGVAAIDLADLDMDADRKQKDLQDALCTLLQKIGLTPIDPRPNDDIQASDHQVVQFVRRSSGARSGAIAHTMSRGVRRGDEVIRKASVLLFE